MNLMPQETQDFLMAALELMAASFIFVVGAVVLWGWLDNLFAAINERGMESAPDFITVDGADGGTGAAPMALIDDMGLPLRESLPLLVQRRTSMELFDPLGSRL